MEQFEQLHTNKSESSSVENNISKDDSQRKESEQTDIEQNKNIELHLGEKCEDSELGIIGKIEEEIQTKKNKYSKNKPYGHI